jgi:threonine aldolase
MRAAMAAAEVGDDVIDQDPTVERLQQRIAQVLGKEAALYMPSGTMTNQVAIRVHCSPGDEFLCEAGCHIYNHEQGAFAQLSGVVAHPIEGQRGILRCSTLRDRIRPTNDHMVRTRLVCIENTHNRGGGAVQPYDEVLTICKWAADNGVRTHLDGARLFNAAVASGIAPHDWAQPFDTVSVCFSKGLGAPVGSALAGPEPLIRLARRHRKVLGGGMRQSGIIAAGALHALENHVDRLSEDHANAQILAEYVRGIDGLRLAYDQVETNILFFDVDPDLAEAPEFVRQLRHAGVLMLAESPRRIRALTHLDVSTDDIHFAGQCLQQMAVPQKPTAKNLA